MFSILLVIFVQLKAKCSQVTFHRQRVTFFSALKFGVNKWSDLFHVVHFTRFCIQCIYVDCNRGYLCYPCTTVYDHLCSGFPQNLYHKIQGVFKEILQTQGPEALTLS